MAGWSWPPPGLTLTAAGVLAGVPTEAGDFPLAVTATSAAGWTGARGYILHIGPAPLVTVGPTALPAAQVGEAYAQAFTASGEAGPYTFAVAGTLPPGMVLSPTGVLTGTPTDAGSDPFTVTATSADGFNGSVSILLTVYPVTLVGPAALPAGVADRDYRTQLTAGPGGPYAFAVTAGAVPPGLTLSATGVLAGTLVAVGDYSFSVTATSTGRVGTQTYAVHIGPAPVVTVGPDTLPVGQVGAAYAQVRTATGAVGPYQFAGAGGTLPAGLALTADGTLAGTPTGSGPFMFAVTATSLDGVTGTRAYTLAVAAAVALDPPALPAGRVGDAYAQALTAGRAGPARSRSPWRPAAPCRPA